MFRNAVRHAVASRTATASRREPPRRSRRARQDGFRGDRHARPCPQRRLTAELGWWRRESTGTRITSRVSSGRTNHPRPLSESGDSGCPASAVEPTSSARFLGRARTVRRGIAGWLPGPSRRPRRRDEGARAGTVSRGIASTDVRGVRLHPLPLPPRRARMAKGTALGSAATRRPVRWVATPTLAGPRCVLSVAARHAATARSRAARRPVANPKEPERTPT